MAARDPERALKILDSILAIMQQAVRRYEGTVNVATDGGVVALSGSP